MRCKACDYCDTTEFSIYHEGLKKGFNGYRWKSVGLDEYCSECFEDMYELYGDYVLQGEKI
jgi:hypothetical protein